MKERCVRANSLALGVDFDVQGVTERVWKRNPIPWLSLSDVLSNERCRVTLSVLGISHVGSFEFESSPRPESFECR